MTPAAFVHYPVVRAASVALLGLALLALLGGFGRAAPRAFPAENVRVTNQTDTSVVITWTSENPTTGSVSYGETKTSGNVAPDLRGEGHLATGHLVVLTNLRPATTYFFAINTGGGTDNNDGQYYEARTGPTIALTPVPDRVVGTVLTESGAPARDTLVYVQVLDLDLTPTTGKSAAYAAITNENGQFTVDLNARKEDLSGVFEYSRSGDIVAIDADGGPLGKRSVQVNSSTTMLRGSAPTPHTLTLSTGATATPTVTATSTPGSPTASATATPPPAKPTQPGGYPTGGTSPPTPTQPGGYPGAGATAPTLDPQPSDQNPPTPPPVPTLISAPPTPTRPPILAPPTPVVAPPLPVGSTGSSPGATGGSSGTPAPAAPIVSQPATARPQAQPTPRPASPDYPAPSGPTPALPAGYVPPTLAPVGPAPTIAAPTATRPASPALAPTAAPAAAPTAGAGVVVVTATPPRAAGTFDRPTAVPTAAATPAATPAPAAPGPTMPVSILATLLAGALLIVGGIVVAVAGLLQSRPEEMW